MWNSIIDEGGAEIAGPENDGPNRKAGICKTWKMTDLKGCQRRHVLTKDSSEYIVMQG